VTSTAPRAPTAPDFRRTRFAPAPTGFLHLGHVANAIFVWGIARARGARVLLRIEDHDRQRSRPEYEAGLLEDLAWLGFEPDEGPIRQSDRSAAYASALERLCATGLAYACACSRADFDASGFSGPGCPRGCRDGRLREQTGLAIRVALGGGSEAWMDLGLGPVAAEVASSGDPPLRDRHGNWTYGFAVVVDDLDQAVDVVIRGRDLLDATAAQIRLARLVGRDAPPAFLHHPLIRKPSGAKLSKADADTAVRELRAAGASPEELIGRAATAVGLVEDGKPVGVGEVARLFR
jgi:glutamyl/glutaminyl-tRNA synthetase